MANKIGIFINGPLNVIRAYSIYIVAVVPHMANLFERVSNQSMNIKITCYVSNTKPLPNILTFSYMS